MTLESGWQETGSDFAPTSIVAKESDDRSYAVEVFASDDDAKSRRNDVAVEIGSGTPVSNRSCIDTFGIAAPYRFFR